MTKYRMAGSTLAEMLVMMIVAGIVFLSVMDGLTLFTRLQLRRTVQMQENGRMAEGYFRAGVLVAEADSLTGVTGELAVWRAGVASRLLLRDSVVLWLCGEFRDTLFWDAEFLLLESGEADTVAVGLRSRKKHFTVKFGVQSPLGKRYCTERDQIERGYGYWE